MRAKRPAFPCLPTGSSASEPSPALWYPIAVTAVWATGSWSCTAPAVATICGSGWPPGSTFGGRERLGRDRRRAPGAERGHEQGQHEDRRKEGGEDEAGGVALGPSPAGSGAPQLSGRTRLHRVPGSGRSHARHDSRPCRLPCTALEPLQCPRIPSLAWLTDGRRSRFHAGFSWSACPCSLLLGVGAGEHARPRDLPLPDRIGDRVPAQPARPAPAARPDAARARRRPRVHVVRGGRRHRARSPSSPSSSTRRARPPTGPTPT